MAHYHVSSYYMCIDWGDLIIHNLTFCIKLQLKFDFRLILIQPRFISDNCFFCLGVIGSVWLMCVV